MERGENQLPIIADVFRVRHLKSKPEIKQEKEKDHEHSTQ